MLICGVRSPQQLFPLTKEQLLKLMFSNSFNEQSESDNRILTVSPSPVSGQPVSLASR